MTSLTANMTLPRIKAPILWHDHYYDGPMSGVCLVDDRLCWFETPDGECDRKRRFFIYEMTDAEVREEVTRHVLFEHYVGVHTCAHATLDGKRPLGATHPRERHHLFYDKDWPRRNLTEGKEPIAKLVRP